MTDIDKLIARIDAERAAIKRTLEKTEPRWWHLERLLTR